MTSAIEPHVRVLKGQPTAAQLAAVVAALATVQQQAATVQAVESSYWNRPQMRRPLPHGAGAWQHSLRNR